MNVAVQDRCLDDLVDLTDSMRGTVAAGTPEARLLHTWSVQSLDEEDPTAKARLFRLVVAQLDKRVDAEKGSQMKAVFARIVGPQAVAATIPLSNPRPALNFAGHIFVFTGKFAVPRTECAAVVERHGGSFSPRVTRKARYLVVGSAPSPTWKYGAWGTKVERAMRYRNERDVNLAIISEMHFNTSANWLNKGLPIVAAQQQGI